MSGSKFFTNEPDNDLYTRFSKILQSNTQLFDILVGYFRTSGFFKLQDSMKDVEKIRILVGLNVDRFTVKIIDEAKDEVEYLRRTEKEGKEIISTEIQKEFINAPVEESVESGVRTFIKWLQSGKLEMRMYTEAPLHAKVYIMRKDPNVSDTKGAVITGSSNFSAAGLVNNLEFNVELRDDDDVDFALKKFEELWAKGVDIRDTYLEAVEQKTWLKDDITPYEIYLKTLYEFFKEEINADKDKLANDIMPDDFMRLQYQVDAVVQAKKILETHGGVFISDVVGLGKTFICAMLAKTLKKGKKLIICPPVIVDYWRQVLLDFDVAATVESLGKLDRLLEKGVDDYAYVFVDEAHRFRNDGTESYSKLHEICNNKKVVLISATPINNYAKDIQSQLYLFESKYDSTIVGVKNLEGFFRKLKSDANKFNKDTPEHLTQLRSNSEEIRNKILRQVMIRRTRGEIETYYGDDLAKQGLSFPKLGAPQQILYTFDKDTDDAFTETMNVIKTFKYSRYQALVYLKDPGEYSRLVAGSIQVGGFMKGILVKRLESSFYAFKKTLDRFVESYEKFIEMFDSGEVWISKKVNVYDLIDSGNLAKLLQLEEDDDAMHFKSNEFRKNFIKDLQEDLATLRYLKSLWATITEDPKLDQFIYELKNNPKMEGEKKIIFTESKETAEYLHRKLKTVFDDRVVSYSGSSKAGLKEAIEDSFNPKYKDKGNNKYDVLITTDVLAEGINLHRANVLINYDIPWNPTRIMQRVGRVNRVGTEHSEIYVFNFFPTSQSNAHLSLEARVMEKLQAFHDTLGEDYKYLSDDEDVSAQGLFEGLNRNLDDDEESANPELSYLTLIRKVRDEDPDLFEAIKKLPRKAKSGRYSDKVSKPQTITFFRKGAYKTFYMNCGVTPSELSFIEAIKYIECVKEEKKKAVGKDYYEHAKDNADAFDTGIAMEQLNTVAEKPSIKGNEAQILKLLRALQRVKTFTDDQDATIKKLIKAYEEGNVAKAYSSNIVKELKTVDDPIESYYVIVNNIPESILKEKKTHTVKYDGVTEIILSDYLVPGDE
ncbi:MAG: helicase [Parasporobacterium sp.]|nr:helicase [Parasporobacterium sp.]